MEHFFIWFQMNFSKYSSRLRMTVAVPLSTCKNTNYVSDCNLLHEKCPNTDMFLVCVFLIWTVYGDLLRKSPYSVQIQENTDEKKLRIWTLCTQWLFQSFTFILGKAVLKRLGIVSFSYFSRLFTGSTIVPIMAFFGSALK